MNKVKTFFCYIGIIMLGNLLINTFGSINNYDFFPDVIYVPIMALMIGFLPFTAAAHFTLKTTNNIEGTRKILWRWKMFLAVSYSLFGIVQFFLGLYLGVPMFEFVDEIGYFTPPTNHWLHNLPVGLIGIYAALRIKNKKENEEVFSFLDK